ncbi:hypothetical protein CQ010_07825 [Arthrobacter sp. MYb211]|uniref:class I SAM-dependent methyltransferase n=1 Tax=unclassified Arthrobacter TaxID=235627 RepID=UPI000CFB86CB|nr:MULTISPECIES: class I SAM-dependent methyltransferase [unclassified Arthrobacter]PRA11978.1 hypothetical protein CQ015_08520 [Arthrobacter sp. MYb221]PRC08333.1 hypothetical protein CQ010_07825 [Arthrobacter sp. MYb211]
MSLNYVETNQNYWDHNSELYLQGHPEHANPGMHPSWGIWHIAESEMDVLTSLLPSDGKVVDLGCGIGHDVVGFADMGFDVWGIELSARQLDNAIPHERAEYVHGVSERLPFEDSFFDAAYSDHGAFDFSPPEVLLREAFRVLKPGGLLAICVYSPLLQACLNGETGSVENKLLNPWLPSTVKSTGEVVVFSYSYSAWVQMFVAAGFVVLRLEELKAPLDGGTYFREHLDRAWAERWPAEQLWVVRRPAE